MRVPIAYALSYPDRLEAPKEEPGLDLTALGEGMTFYKLDRDVFRTVDLAYEACRRGGSYPWRSMEPTRFLWKCFCRER